MATKSKQKGNSYERELVDQLKDFNIEAKRAWGSNGQALGESEGVDLIFEHEGKRWRVQAKRREKLAKYTIPPEGADIVMMREDRGQTYVVLTLHDFIDML